jgi:hypothetical protein
VSGFIELKDICNLSKLPLPISKNPFKDIASSYLNGEDGFEIAKELFWDSVLKTKFSKTLGDFYNIESSAISNLPSDTLFFPWIHHTPVNRNNSHEIFMSIFHNQNYLKFHCERIKPLIPSIQKYGYNPEKFPTRQGGISGYFLEGLNKKKFYVTAGNHRVAALAALFPEYKIPIVIENKSHFKPRDLENRGALMSTYSYKDIDSWPAVKNNFLKKDHALKILQSYVQ